MLRENAQGRQKRPNKQKQPPPRVSHSKDGARFLKPSSGRSDFTPTSINSTGKRIEPLPLFLPPPEEQAGGGKAGRWAEKQATGSKKKIGGKKKIPNPSGRASVPAEIKSSSANLHPQPTPPSSVSAWGRCPGIPLSLAPTVRPRAEQPEPGRQEAPLSGWTPGRARTFRSTFRQLVQSR